MTCWVVDTGPLVAFFDRSDRYHEWAKAQWAHAPVPMLSCEAVLAEATYLLHEHAGLDPARLLALVERKLVSLPFSLQQNAGAVIRLLERYGDLEMQLADACVVRMSELERNCRVFTVDKREFQIYRRFERQLIPLVAPD
jgi:predicted nucleic acid-binding protein